MRTQIYDHRSGLKVVPNDIVADVKNIIWNINPALSKKTVSSLKESQKSRVKAEKTKIFFQKASSGFGDVSFKERSGRFKA